MRLSFIPITLAVIVFQGCLAPASAPSRPAATDECPTPPPEVVERNVEPDVCDEARELSDAARRAYREVIVCGDLVSLTARGVAARLIMSAPDTEDTTRTLLEVLSGADQWNLGEDGLWAAQNMANGEFVLRVLTPDGEPIDIDPFTFEAYLENVVVEQDLTFAEMFDAPDQQNTWTFSFDGPGPLYDVLAQGEKLESPLVFRASLDEVRHLAAPEANAPLEAPDLGPFDPLLDLRFEAYLTSRAQTTNGEVEVLASLPDESVRNLIAGRGRALRIDSVVVTHPDLEIELEHDLAYRLGPGLFGYIAWAMSDGETQAVSHATYKNGEFTAFTCGLRERAQPRPLD